jgi:hypothetical protein
VSDKEEKSDLDVFLSKAIILNAVMAYRQREVPDKILRSIEDILIGSRRRETLDVLADIMVNTDQVRFLRKAYDQLQALFGEIEGGRISFEEISQAGGTGYFDDPRLGITLEEVRETAAWIKEYFIDASAKKRKS